MSKKTIGFSGIGSIELMNRIGSNIRTSRKNRKMTRAQLASLSGIGISTLARLESGDAGVSIGILLTVLAVMRLDNIKSCRIAEQEDDHCFVEPLKNKERQELEKLLDFNDE
jgi:transcriptional regulator with XRE-family HTH domain